MAHANQKIIDSMHACAYILYTKTALSSTLFTIPSTPMEAWPGACSLPEKMMMNSML